jgi:hypothetical protein
LKVPPVLVSIATCRVSEPSIFELKLTLILDGSAQQFREHHREWSHFDTILSALFQKRTDENSFSSIMERFRTLFI